MFGVTRDRLVVEFKGGDRVYVDSEDIGLIRKYTGGEDAAALEDGRRRLGEDARAACGKAVRDIAAELVDPLPQAPRDARSRVRATTVRSSSRSRTRSPTRRRPTSSRRSTRPRPTWSGRSRWTGSICGDVGYGKTEVALRAAAKAVFDGKQVAVLVPTTLLASQHGQTFRERFANYPVRVEVLSRFLIGQGAERGRRRACRTARSTSSSARTGCSPSDMQFKDLGLLVVDEEQRFGVQHKERIKKMRTDVDVLTLTATPIPRTLEMSLTGIRDLSLVQHAARGSPADPHLRRRVRRACRLRSDPPRAAARGPGALRAQPRAGHRARRRRRARARARSAGRGRARTDGRRPARAGRARSSGSTSTTCSCARRSSRAASTCRR